MNYFYCFVHIEKCAGTTFHHLMNYNLPGYVTLRPWHKWTNDSDSVFKQDELKILKRIYPLLTGIGGHSVRSYLKYEEVLNKKLKYFTFFRDPVERYISHFIYQKYKMNKKWSIEDFLNEHRFNNYITNRIAGKNDVELAKKNLKHFSFIGLQEEFDLSLLLLNKNIFDFKLNPLYEKKNVAPKNIRVTFDSFEKKVQTRIIENNKLDIELYELVKSEIFPNYISNYGESLNDDFETFNKDLTNFKYNPIKKTTLKLLKGLTYYIFEPTAHLLKKNSNRH